MPAFSSERASVEPGAELVLIIVQSGSMVHGALPVHTTRHSTHNDELEALVVGPIRGPCGERRHHRGAARTLSSDARRWLSGAGPTQAKMRAPTPGQMSGRGCGANSNIARWSGANGKSTWHRVLRRVGARAQTKMRVIAPLAAAALETSTFLGRMAEEMVGSTGNSGER